MSPYENPKILQKKNTQKPRRDLKKTRSSGKKMLSYRRETALQGAL